MRRAAQLQQEYQREMALIAAAQQQHQQQPPVLAPNVSAPWTYPAVPQAAQAPAAALAELQAQHAAQRPSVGQPQQQQVPAQAQHAQQPRGRPERQMPRAVQPQQQEQPRISTRCALELTACQLATVASPKHIKYCSS